MIIFYYLFPSDNDQPTLNASNNYPVEAGTNITLTCEEVISTHESVVNYEWYKDGSSTKVPNEDEAIYYIGNQRSAGGNYTCKVVATNSGTSIQSAPQSIMYYCEFKFNISSKSLSLQNQGFILLIVHS